MNAHLEQDPDGPPASAPWRRVGALLGVAYLALWLLLAPSYGPTWDAVMTELPYGEAFYATLEHGDPDYMAYRWNPELERREPHPDFSVGRLPWYAAWPQTAFLGAAFCELLWTRWELVQPLVAHHLGIGLWVALAIAVMFVWLGRRVGWIGACAGVLAFACMPRFFAHSFNNLKDVPEACLYFFSLLAALATLRDGGWRRHAGLGLLVGLTLAHRPNALFLGPTLALLWVFELLRRRWRRRMEPVVAGDSEGEPADERLTLQPGPILLAFVLMACAYFVATPALWVDPLGRLEEQLGFWLRSTSTSGVGGALGHEGISRHGWYSFLWATPLLCFPLLLIGLFERRASACERCLLFLGFSIPVLRTLLPGMRDYDGVRHFLEFHPPLAALVGLGTARLVGWVRGLGPDGMALRKLAPVVALLVCLVWPWLAWSTHPNGVLFYNAWAGGISGARARGMSDAHDYWANSYWQGLGWISEHAEPGATLIVPVAEHVARSAAPVRLRDDIVFPPDPAGQVPRVLYAMRVLRGDRLQAGVLQRLEAGEPTYAITLDDDPVCLVYRFEDEEAAEIFSIWARADLAQKGSSRVFQWLKKHPDLLQELARLRKREGLDAALTRLDEVLPEEYVEDAEAFVRWSLDPENRRMRAPATDHE